MSKKTFKRNIKRIAVSLIVFVLVVLVLVYVVIQVDFRRWRRNLYSSLQTGSVLINTDRGSMEYVTLGEGPAVLLLHGAPGGYDQAMPMLDFQIIAPSRPGYLRTKLSVGDTYEEQAKAYVSLLDSLGIDRAAVLGFSAGGPPALQFATQYPERTWAVILISAVTKKWILPELEPSVFRNVTDQVFGRDFADWLMARAVMQFPERLLLDQENELLSAGDRQILRRDPEKLRFLLDVVTNKIGPWSLRYKGIANDLKQYASLSETGPLPISAPTLVIHGTDDAAVDPSHAKSVHSRIRDSELAMIHGAGHAVWFAHYDEVESLVLQFLNEHKPIAENQKE